MTEPTTPPGDDDTPGGPFLCARCHTLAVESWLWGMVTVLADKLGLDPARVVRVLVDTHHAAGHPPPTD